MGLCCVYERPLHRFITRTFNDGVNLPPALDKPELYDILIKMLQDRLHNGYEMLGGAVIRQAIWDVRKRKGKVRKDALSFLRTKRLDVFITAFELPLSASYVRKKLKKEGII